MSRNRTVGRLGLATAALTVATALVVGTAAGAPRAPRLAHTTPACTFAQLVNWLNTTGNGYAGGIGYELQFTNVSAHACSLRGFPGVSAVEQHGHQVGAPATRSGSTGPTVTVNPGATVKAAWLVTDTGNFPASACKPVTAVGVKVYAPNLRRADVIPFPFSVCSKASTPSLAIETVTP